MEDEKERFLRKLRQIDEHGRALTQDLPPGEAQNRARLIWGLAAHLLVKYELEHTRALTGIPHDAQPLPPRSREI